jgi:hypothetical protein
MIALTPAEWEDLMKRFPIDPYLVWSDLTGYRQFQTGEKELKVLCFLVELKQPYDPDTIHDLNIPGLFCQPLNGQRHGCFVTVRISIPTPDFIPPLRDLIEHWAVKRVQLGFPVTAEQQEPSSNTGAARPLPASYEADCDVVCGLMDDGCAFAHEQFRVEGQPKTRVVALWDQTPLKLTTESTNGSVPYGREFTNSDFDASIASHWLGDEVDEVACYLDTFGTQQHGLDTARTHGTAVMDLFAGKLPPRRRPVGSCGSDTADSPIVFVQFPVAESTVANGRWLATHVLEGLYYIFDAARRIEIDGKVSDDRKIVVTLSYGALAGPHNGSGMLTRALEEASCLRGDLGIVLAAGNSRSARCHATRSIKAQGRVTFSMIVPPVKPFETYAEIWVDKADAIEITVTAPNGVERTVTVGKIALWPASDFQPGASAKDLAAALVFPQSAVQGTQGTMVLLVLASAETTAHGVWSPPGKWEIAVVNGDKNAPRSVRVWIERDDLLDIHPQQYAHFDRSDDMAGDNDLKPTPSNNYVTIFDTLTSVAGGDHLYPTGGYTNVRRPAPQAAPATLSNYSGQGSSEEDPFLYACTDEGFGAPGIRVAGTVSGSYTRMSGTSVAAPQAARALVRAMHKVGDPLSADQIKDLYCKLPDCELLKFSDVGAPHDGQGPLVVIEIAPAR